MRTTPYSDPCSPKLLLSLSFFFCPPVASLPTFVEAVASYTPSVQVQWSSLSLEGGGPSHWPPLLCVPAGACSSRQHSLQGCAGRAGASPTARPGTGSGKHGQWRLALFFRQTAEVTELRTEMRPPHILTGLVLQPNELDSTSCSPPLLPVCSLATLYRKVSAHKGPCFLFVRDSEKHVS